MMGKCEQTTQRLVGCETQVTGIGIGMICVDACGVFPGLWEGKTAEENCEL